MSMFEFFEKHSSYVLVGRDQYEVLLDDKENPKEMWCPILFCLGDRITLDGGKPQYVIVREERGGMGIWKYELRIDE